MKILHLSDTHNQHLLLNNLPLADVVVHSGDITRDGTKEEVKDFVEWYEALPYRYKLFVAGNHDKALFEIKHLTLSQNAYFLQDESVTIDGIKFFGLGYKHSEKIIPKDTDVLITHEPPTGILDTAGPKLLGNDLLRDKVIKIRPKCHLFGHAHGSNGIIEKDSIIYSNAALLDHEYKMIALPRVIAL